MAAVVDPDAIEIEAAGIPADIITLLHDGDVGPIAVHQLPGGSNARRPRPQNRYPGAPHLVVPEPSRSHHEGNEALGAGTIRVIAGQ